MTPSVGAEFLSEVVGAAMPLLLGGGMATTAVLTRSTEPGSATDLGRRIVHAGSPIPHRCTDDRAYSWVPTAGGPPAGPLSSAPLPVLT